MVFIHNVKWYIIWWYCYRSDCTINKYNIFTADGMLLVLKEYNTTGCCYQCSLLYLLSMIIKSDMIYTSVNLYTIIHTDDAMVYMYLFMLLASICVVCYICGNFGVHMYLDTSKLWICIIVLFMFL